MKSHVWVLARQNRAWREQNLSLPLVSLCKDLSRSGWRVGQYVYILNSNSERGREEGRYLFEARTTEQEGRGEVRDLCEESNWETPIGSLVSREIFPVRIRWAGATLVVWFFSRNISQSSNTFIEGLYSTIILPSNYNAQRFVIILDI